ncbi:MAG: metal ABC transporter ATP-binding protein [Mariprofundaceae bacterium]|nr:metal ABC transporter ATP-binding protein [Mariprofundaceae bacterium]
MNSSVLSLSHISFGPKKRPVLDDLSFSLKAGHFMGIIGPNGAGKSTILSVMTGLIQPSQGHVYLFGSCLTHFNRHKLLKKMGYLHQLHNAEPHMPLTVSDVVAMGLLDYSKPLWCWIKKSSKYQEAIEKALSYVDMLDFLNHDFRYLSGGQRQRIRLARALVRQPQLLLLDEPSAALDSHQQQKLYLLLRQLCDEQNMTIIMVEHDIAAITGHVDSVACLNRKIHHHAMKGEQIPEDVWHQMYGEHMHVLAHDTSCIGCHHD